MLLLKIDKKLHRYPNRGAAALFKSRADALSE